jgi:hypothetical protein
MPITAIPNQPGTNSIQAAYRPIVIITRASAEDGVPLPPVVYCDIYFGGVFYKTLSKTQSNIVNAEDSDWQFDLQDAAQEYLKKYLGINGGSALLSALPVMTKCYCRLRSSNWDANGFILPDGVAPIQATGSTPAVSGTGLPTNDFFILNATLQHEDNQDLATHLNAFKTRTWNGNSYPLTHRPDGYHISMTDSDYFPVMIPSTICVGGLALNYKYKGQSTIRRLVATVAQPCNAVITSLTGTQVADTQNVRLDWTATGDITGFIYRIDGGAWIATALTSVVVNSMSIADHTVEVAGICQCSQGAIRSQAFTIANPATFTCTSVVSGLTVTQIGQGEVSVAFSSSGPATTWNKLIDGQRSPNLNATSGNIDGFSVGSHTVKITPICSNGVAGTGQEVTFTVNGVPTITKTNEFSSGPGSIRTQEFTIGPSVIAGNKFLLTLYSHEISVTADSDDTPSTIATSLKNAINATSTTDWDDHASAPPTGTNGFPPVATSTANVVTVSFDWQHSFAYSTLIS